MNDSEVFRELRRIRDKALARYSNFKVGALISTKGNKYFSGINIESSSYGLTMCAERVALFKALSEGEKEFDTIYILASNDDFCPPCGACRQMLMDYAPDLTVVLFNEKGNKKTFLLKNLLPEAFTPKYLRDSQTDKNRD
ncbi:MAG: cytidine deaminase [Calditrichia bacterium]